MDETMRPWMICLLAGCSFSTLQAHHPDGESIPVHQPIDLIGPLGNRLPPSYRRRYNRPTNVGGRIAYYIAPTSQEAMRWHQATHQGQYRCKSPRMMGVYYYPKPWEALRIGARPKSERQEESEADREIDFGQSLPEPGGLQPNPIDVDGEALDWNEAEAIEIPDAERFEQQDNPIAE